MNKCHDFARLEDEYVTSDLSLRELCRRLGISALRGSSGETN